MLRSNCVVQSLQALHAENPEEAIDRTAYLKLERNPEFYSTFASDLRGDEQSDNMGLLQNNSLMASSPDVGMGQVYNVANGYEESRNYNASSDNGTGIRIRTRQVPNDLPNMNPVTQGTAQRRIRLQRRLGHPLSSSEVGKDGSCDPEDHDSKPTIAGVRRLFCKSWCLALSLFLHVL